MNESELKEKIRQTQHVVIELGCGNTKDPHAIGIDRFALEGVDFVADMEKGLGFLDDNSVDEIKSSHFLEHIANLELLLSEIHRVLKPGGRHIVRVPHFSNPYFYSDYTHSRFFGLYTFDYFSLPQYQLRRKVPVFYNDVKFGVVERRLVFKSVFPVRNLKKRLFGWFFNISPYMQELYEESFCYIIPCQELYFSMLAIKDEKLKS